MSDLFQSIPYFTLHMALEAVIIGFDNYRVGDAIASVSAGMVSLMMKYVHFDLISNCLQFSTK